MRKVNRKADRKWVLAAQLYAEGNPISEIAENCKTSQSTIRNWIRNPDFVEFADEIRTEYYQQFFGHVATLAEEALQKTAEIMRSKKVPSKTALSAAFKIIDVNERAAKDRLLVKEQLYSLTNKEQLSELFEIMEDAQFN